MHWNHLSRFPVGKGLGFALTLKREKTLTESKL